MVAKSSLEKELPIFDWGNDSAIKHDPNNLSNVENFIFESIKTSNIAQLIDLGGLN